MSDFAPILTELRRPFAADAVKWKIQTNPDPQKGKKAMIVAHIDARLVAARLNAVAPDWSSEFTEGLHQSVVCRLTVCGQTREDVGWHEVTDRDGEITDAGIKGLYSDAFKRAAVQFGVGAFLYSLPRQYAAANQLKSVGRSWYMTAQLERSLRDSYAAWLKSTGLAEFGEPLEHGSVPIEAEEPVEPGPAPSNGNGSAPEGIDLSLVKGIREKALQAKVSDAELGLLLVTLGVEDRGIDGIPNGLAGALTVGGITQGQAKQIATALTEEQAQALLDSLDNAEAKA